MADLDPESGSYKNVPSDAILWDILESVTDAVVTIDEHHRVLLCNRAAEELFGYSCREILGRDASPLIPNPHQTLHRSYIERYLQTGIPRVIGKSRECFAQHRLGHTIPVEISYSVSRTVGRLYFTAVIRDISERKHIERELRFLERLADVGKAVAQVSHEIRKPLMLMGGFARQVRDSSVLEGDEGLRRKLGIIVDEVGRLETLLNSVRLLTRPAGSSRKAPLDINRLIEEVGVLMEPLLQGQAIEVALDLDPEPLDIEGDADQLKQVLLNLLQNAVDAMNGAGRLRVWSLKRSGLVEVGIQDSGSGIPESVQERIFDPFFTTKADGSGLGLAISRSIVQDHGGSLRLESTPDQGTTFIIGIPLAAD
ncbi:MAG: PAS domain S-box protein [Syntrophobacteraceae bacterium]|nr:PAS domain S-box protein [Syntrophobacteraceae bacterium]